MCCGTYNAFDISILMKGEGRVYMKEGEDNVTRVLSLLRESERYIPRGRVVAQVQVLNSGKHLLSQRQGDS